jgi:5-dehydro-4-deoxyglucarate dehydratase
MKELSAYEDITRLSWTGLGARAPRAATLSAWLRERIATSVLAFPLTPFTGDGAQIDVDSFRRHVRGHIDHGAGALFICCGTGEFAALREDEYRTLTAVAVEEAGGRVPVISGAGYGWIKAAEFACIAEESGVDGILVLPHYLVAAPQDGIVTHFRRIAESTDLPLIVYQRGLLKLEPESLAEIARIPTVIGLKDGQGDMVSLQQMTIAMPNDFVFFNGALTAEVQHRLYSSIGIRAYSSAFHSCAPEIAKAFFESYNDGDDEMVDRLLREVYFPFVRLRDTVHGYPVSLIKAAARLRGQQVGPVRAPLADPGHQDLEQLEAIMRHGLGVVGAGF